MTASPTPTIGARRMTGLWILLIGIFVVDVAMPLDVELLPYFWLPLVFAAGFADVKPLGRMTLASIGLALIAEQRWAHLHRPQVLEQLALLGVIGLASLSVAAKRARAQRIQRESEKNYQMLAENASNVVFRASRQGGLEWISPSVTRLLGWTPAQMIGKPFREFVHPDDLELLQRVQAAFAQGEEPQFRLRVRRAQGGYQWVEVNARGARDGGPDVLAIIGSWSDIAAKVADEQAMAQTLARLTATLDSLLDPHVVLRARRNAMGAIEDFTYMEANGAACHYNQLSHDELVGHTLLEVLPGHSGQGLLALYIQAVESGEPLVLDDYPYPHEILGQTRRYDIRGVPQGEELVYTWRDVTERYESLRELAASEEAYRLLALNASDVVVRLRDDVITYVSPSLAGALGWSPEEWLGRSSREVLHPDDLLEYANNLEAIAAGQCVVCRHRIRAKDNSWHWAELHVGPYLDSQNCLDGMVASFRLIDREMAAWHELERHARTDALTGLLNRREVLEQIHTLSSPDQRSGEQTALLFCDLDRFKAINDRWGHAAGDQLLRTVASRIQACLRSEDVAARMGGDELLVVLKGVQNLDSVLVIAEKIRNSVQDPVPTAAGDLQITLSIGATLVVPGESSDAMIDRADTAMYQAKQTGRNRVIPITG